MNNTHDFLRLSPQEFIGFLKNEGINRFYFVFDSQTGTMECSHHQLEPISQFIVNDKRDFKLHEGLFFQLSKQYDTLLGAFIHRTNRGQAAGGVRYWHYKTVEDYLRDGLRLGKGMTRKNALAGLWWGGGKGVMAHNLNIDKYDPTIRTALYKEYGSFMTSLLGCYVTAEDVGTHVTDMLNVFSNTRFTTCIPPEQGGSGNPSVPTAKGVISGMEAGLDFIRQGELKGKVVAVQGMGNVAEPLIQYLFEKDVAKVVANDINKDIVEKVKNRFADNNLQASVVEQNDFSIFSVECDVFSPCATGAILNPNTIPKINAKIICGAANNQLEDADRDDKALQNRGVIYIPDFLTNRMGIVNAANEQYGYVNADPFFDRHLSKEWTHSIYQTSLRVLKESQETGDSSSKVAIRLADKLSLEYHPIFGHRGQQIIDSLIENKWHLS